MMTLWDGWENEYEVALQRALQEKKAVMVQFEREGCLGCARLYATTYPDPDVRQELLERFIPVKLDILKERAVRSQLSAVWTPSLYFLDTRGRLFHSVPGYLPPEDFRLTLRLALAKIYIPKGKYSEALAWLNEGLTLFPDNPLNAQLLYWKIIAHYLKTWDKEAMRQGFEELRRRFPGSTEARMWPYAD